MNWEYKVSVRDRGGERGVRERRERGMVVREVGRSAGVKIRR